jgi:hypothetical protein
MLGKQNALVETVPKGTLTIGTGPMIFLVTTRTETVVPLSVINTMLPRNLLALSTKGGVCHHPLRLHRRTPIE